MDVPAIFVKVTEGLGRFDAGSVEAHLDPMDKPLGPQHVTHGKYVYRHWTMAFDPHNRPIWLYIEHTTKAKEALAERVAKSQLEKEGLRIP